LQQLSELIGRAHTKRSAAQKAGVESELEKILKVTNEFDMEFAAIPAGSFYMGNKLSPEEASKKYGGEKEWYESERPRHNVTINRPFYLQSNEVTQGQWKKVMGDIPSAWSVG
jgi:formylglycine-generating enzyme required for sulfatase activity